MHRLRFLTLNAWTVPWPISRDVEPRMRAIGERLPTLDADVVVFQEVWTRRARVALLRSVHRSGGQPWWHHQQSSGLLVLSRIPVRSPRFHSYTLNGLPHRPHHLDYYGNKGFLRIDIDTAAGPVALLITHLHARHSSSVDEMGYMGHRAAQVVELADAVGDIRQPVVALGDFNLHEGSPHYDVLTGLSGLIDAAAALDRRQNTIEYANPYRLRGHDPGRRIDYVFTRSGETAGMRPLHIQRVLDEPLEIDGRLAAYSDHAGLLAEVEVGRDADELLSPDPTAVKVARALLETGRQHAELRRQEEGTLAVSGSIACAAVLAARGGVASRRGFLRTSALGLAGVGLAGMKSLSDDFVTGELTGYERVSAVLDRLESRPGRSARRRHRPAKPARPAPSNSEVEGSGTTVISSDRA